MCGNEASSRSSPLCSARRVTNPSRGDVGSGREAEGGLEGALVGGAAVKGVKRVVAGEVRVGCGV